MPRQPSELDPKRWTLLEGLRIGCDVTRRRKDRVIDRRCNNKTIVVAEMLLHGEEGEALAEFIVGACNRSACSAIAPLPGAGTSNTR